MVILFYFWKCQKKIRNYLFEISNIKENYNQVQNTKIAENLEASKPN